VFYFACQNSKDFSECTGFLMLNGESERLLKRGLTEHDLEYIENAHSVIQRSIDNGQHEQANVILRDIGQLRERVAPQPTNRASGFTHMVECARGVSTVPTQEPEPTPETRGTSGFSAMLSASSKDKKTPEDAIQKALDEMEQDEAKHRQQSSKPTRRGMGFGNMLAASQTGTFEGDEEPQPETRSLIQSGFQRRGAGFGSMLEASRRGTFEGDEEFKSQPETRSGYGFRAMLDGASRGNATGQSVETEYDVKPIPCGLAAMLDAMSPNRTRDTLDEKPHVRRGMGFTNMLRDAAEGTE
jgi:hypothetical protein